MINIDTGEYITSNSSDKEVSDALLNITVKIKELEDIQLSLKDEAKKRLFPGQTKFANYWDIRWVREKLNLKEDIKKLSVEDRKLLKMQIKMLGKSKEVLFKEIKKEKEVKPIIYIPKY